jgi:hypothetical protein
MKQNLDTLVTEILEHLESQGFVVFHGFSRTMDTHPVVYWNIGRHPDFRMFLETARQVGVKMVVFHHREFSPDAIDDALERLEECDLAPEDKLGLESRLGDLRAYQGFTCAVQLSFDYEGRVYVYDLHTDWYLEFLDALDEIDSYVPEEEDEEDEGPIGGYFSRN